MEHMWKSELSPPIMQVSGIKPRLAHVDWTVRGGIHPAFPTVQSQMKTGACTGWHTHQAAVFKGHRSQRH